MRYSGKLTALVLTLLSATSIVQAGDKEDALIAKVAKAYGADALTAAKSLTIRDNYKRVYWEQGASPSFTEVIKNNVDFTIDFEGQRKSLTEWESSGRGTRLTQTVFDGEKGRIYDLFHRNYDAYGWLTYASVGGHIMRYHDTVLARLAWDTKETAKYAGETYYRGAAHDSLLVKMEAGPELTLHINRETGLISKAARTSAHAGEIVYAFSNHKVTDGVTYAADLQVNVAGEPDMISVARGIDVNPSLENVFTEPANFAYRGETIDSSEMSVRTLADGVYFAGQGYAFSLFVDAGDYFVGAGGNPGLGARFAAVQKETGLEKPLKYQVVTHHHSDHIAGMQNAAELGASFISVAEHMPPVQASLKEEVSADRFEFVSGKATIADGAVELYEMASTHSAQNLLVYVPAAKVMFVADHFSTDLKTGLPNADKGTVILRKKINDLQLDAATFLGAHGARILTIGDLHTVADSYAEGICPKGISVCAD